MMEPSLLLSLTGLALIDSLNLSTVWVIVAILLFARRPAATGWTFAAGAFASFLAGTLVFYFATNAADSVLFELTHWLRRIIFALISATFLVLAVRRLKSRPRHQLKLPSWVNPWSGLPLGFLATVADLPNAFPMFLAVERVVNAGASSAVAVSLLVGYAIIYMLPTVALLVIGTTFGKQMRSRIQRLYDKYTHGEAKASWKLATLYVACAAATAAFLFLVIR